MKKKVSFRENEERYIREESTISICSSKCKMFIRLPLGFTMFGKLKKPYKKLLFGMLKKNVGLICYNMRDRYSFDCCIKDENINDFINSINKKRYTIDFDYFDEHSILIRDDFFVYREQENKKWYIMFNMETLIDRYSLHKLLKENQKMNFIPFKHNIYGLLNINNRKEAKLIDTLELVNLSSNNTIYKMSSVNHFGEEWKKEYKHGIYKFYALETYDKRDTNQFEAFTSICKYDAKNNVNPDIYKGLVLAYSYLRKDNNRKNNKTKHDMKRNNKKKKTVHNNNRNNHSRRKR